MISQPKELTDRDRTICRTHGLIFESANEHSFDMEDFTIKYMKSDFCARCMDVDYSVYQIWWPEESISELLDEIDIEKTELPLKCIDTLNWIGYMYRFICISYDLTCRKMSEVLTFRKMMEYFYPLHTMSYEQAAYRILEENISLL